MRTVPPVAITLLLSVSCEAGRVEQPLLSPPPPPPVGAELILASVRINGRCATLGDGWAYATADLMGNGLSVWSQPAWPELRGRFTVWMTDGPNRALGTVYLLDHRIDWFDKREHQLDGRAPTREELRVDSIEHGRANRAGVDIPAMDSTSMIYRGPTFEEESEEWSSVRGQGLVQLVEVAKSRCSRLAANSSP
jgi:hypothetical protein